MNSKNSVDQDDNLQVISSHNGSIELEEYKNVPTSNTIKNLDNINNPPKPSLFSRVKICLRGYLFYIFITLFEISGIICYALSLKGCNLPQAQCLVKYNGNTIYLLFVMISLSSLSYVTSIMLVQKKIIKWYHLAATSLAYFSLFFVNFGADLSKHGILNIFAFIILDIFFFIVYSIVGCFYNIIKKKRYILLIIIISTVLLISLWIFPNSCRSFYKGLGGKVIDNDPEFNGCEFPTPKFCLLSRLDNLIDYSKLTLLSCSKHNKNEKNIFHKYLNKNLENATRFAYPSTTEYDLQNQVSLLRFSQEMLDGIINLDEENPKQHHEITLEFNEKKEGTIHINIKRNDTLVKERQKIRKSLNKQLRYKNILMVYIDAISRQHFLRKLKETKRFIEQYLYDSSKENIKERVSFQFFKYHAFAGWTHISVAPMFYGEAMTNGNGTNLIKYYQNYGYITGMSENLCSKEVFDVENGDPNTKNRVWVNWDHENVAMFCDTNYFDNKVPYTTWKGPNSGFRRCLYGRDTYEYVIEYAEQFWRAYKDEPKFFRMSFMDAHEDSLEVVKYLDRPLIDMINGLDLDGQLEDTALIFISDHGNNMFAFSHAVSPDFHFERVLASLFIVLPNSKDEEMQEHFKKMEKNSQKYVSPYDIHDTLLYMLYYNDVDRKDIYSATGQTLFEEIDGTNRKCSTYKDFEFGLCICKSYGG